MAAEPTVQELRDLVAGYEPGKGHLLPALHRIQETYGYISRDAIDVVARQLKTTAALVYGTVSFYTDLRTHHPPQREISWCSGPACRLAGGERIREAIEHTLGLPLVGHSEDNRYGLHLGQCVGGCHESPQVWVNGEVRGNLTVADAIRLAREVKAAR